MYIDTLPSLMSMSCLVFFLFQSVCCQMDYANCLPVNFSMLALQIAVVKLGLVWTLSNIELILFFSIQNAI